MAYEGEKILAPTASEPPPSSHTETFELPGGHHIEVPPALGKIMHRMLEAQALVDQRKEELSVMGMDIEETNTGIDELVDWLRNMNCHKPVLFARGEISEEQLTAMAYIDEADAAGKFRQRPDTAGHPEVIKLLEENPDKVIVNHEDVEAYLTEHASEGPFSVHVIRKRQPGEAHYEGEHDVWRPAHSFIFLGLDEAGNKMCFHKRGPTLHMRVEVTTMEKIMEPYHDTVSQFLVLPMKERDAE